MSAEAKKEVLIKVTDLKKHYNNGAVKALDGINAEIYRGEVVVIIGPSGSGKSTFLRSLNLLELPTSGKIELDGIDITDKKININNSSLKKVKEVLNEYFIEISQDIIINKHRIINFEDRYVYLDGINSKFEVSVRKRKLVRKSFYETFR